MPSSSDRDDIKELKNKCWDNILTIVKAGRSSGIHLIALTQRTTVSNLPSDVKSQMCRISFRQISTIDSKNIIECEDATNLEDRECLVYGTSKTMEIVKTPFLDEDFKVLSDYVKEIIAPENSINKAKKLHGIKTIIVNEVPRELPLLEEPIKNREIITAESSAPKLQEEAPGKKEVAVKDQPGEIQKEKSQEQVKEGAQETKAKKESVLYQRPPKKVKKGMIKIEIT